MEEIRVDLLSVGDEFYLFEDKSYGRWKYQFCDGDSVCVTPVSHGSKELYIDITADDFYVYVEYKSNLFYE